MHFEVIGETRDDAVGEAYDKVARTIDLPYPGGPQIDKLAQYGKDTYDFPRVWLEKESYDFSFSGLKSSVINKLHNLRQKNEEVVKEDVATSFQNSVVDVLSTKAINACKAYKVNRLIVLEVLQVIKDCDTDYNNYVKIIIFIYPFQVLNYVLIMRNDWCAHITIISQELH